MRPILLIALITICGCAASPDYTGSFDLGKLHGRWESLNQNTTQIEEWGLVAEGDLRGRGFVLEGRDTTFIEFLSIKEIDDTLRYFAQVSDQNDGETIEFKMRSQSKNIIEFANPAHDFPKRIVYEIEADSVLHTFIEGPRDGRTIRINFDYIRR